MVGKKNGVIVQDINVFKDNRVKTCNQIIEGIKFIKLYGWEIAFKHIIQALRKQEIRGYLKLAFWRSMERILGMSTATLAGFVCFLVIDLTG